MQLNLGTHSQDCNENLDYSTEEQTTSGISSFVHEKYQNYGNAQSYCHLSPTEWLVISYLFLSI